MILSPPTRKARGEEVEEEVVVDRDEEAVAEEVVEVEQEEDHSDQEVAAQVN